MEYDVLYVGDCSGSHVVAIIAEFEVNGGG